MRNHELLLVHHQKQPTEVIDIKGTLVFNLEIDLNMSVWIKMNHLQ